MMKQRLMLYTWKQFSFAKNVKVNKKLQSLNLKIKKFYCMVLYNLKIKDIKN